MPYSLFIFAKNFSLARINCKSSTPHFAKIAAFFFAVFLLVYYSFWFVCVFSFLPFDVSVCLFLLVCCRRLGFSQVDGKLKATLLRVLGPRVFPDFSRKRDEAII